MVRIAILLVASASAAWFGAADRQPHTVSAYFGSAADRSTPDSIAAREPVTIKSHDRREFNQADDGLFYVEALVNGTPVRFVVDTGATMVVLTADDAAAVSQGSDTGGRIKVQTASGTTAMRTVKLREVAIAGRTVKNIDAAVMNDNLPVSLLGQNLLSQLDSVTMKGSRLELN